ncbi:MAG: nuclear transport factor 2 family protein [Kofleriaceae bacterium]
MKGSGDSSDELTRKRPTIRREIARDPSHVGANVQSAPVMEPYHPVRTEHRFDQRVDTMQVAPLPIEPDPPGRALLRTAGLLSQLGCAICLLLGTIAVVLVQQNKSGGIGYAIAWGVAALFGVVFGGLMGRGALVTVIGSALLDAAFGIVLIAVDYDTLRDILRVLPTSDVDTIADVITAVGVTLTVIATLCLAAIPQAVRYVRWLRVVNGDPRTTAASTARGFPPPPVAAARGSVWQIPTTAPEETRSRRRMYFALAGFAIGFGAGIGVLVSSKRPAPAVAEIVPVDRVKPGNGTVSKDDRTGATETSIDDGKVPVAAVADRVMLPGAIPIDDHIKAQREAIASGKLDLLAETLWPKAVAFGTDADELAEGRDAIMAKLGRELGDLSGQDVTSRSLAIGEEGNHAWIAEELEIGSKRYAITQLAAFVGGKWMTVAMHWAIQIPDAKAERMEILHTLRKPKAITNVVDGPKDLEPALRAAFASRAANAEARSARPKSFNFGSGPGERMLGGNRIKQIFGKLRSEIGLRDGIRAMASSAWDPSQQAAPTVAFAALNADFITRTKAATDLTHTFRVLVILVKEGSDWRIVSSQWSHGGPF